MAKQKIAILGGGPSALATAYWLSESPLAAQRYEITVYTQGWRLGGKCASGRSVDGAHPGRIEEHGLHIWFGFYENAFCTYRKVLEALKALPGSKVRCYLDWREAFAPHSLVVLGDNGPEGLEQWPLLFSENAREPGCEQRPSDWGMFVEALQLGLNFFEGRFGDDDEFADFFEGFALPDWATRLLWKAETEVRSRLLLLVHEIARHLPDDPLTRFPGLETLLATLLTAFRATVRHGLSRRVPEDVRARRIFVVTDLLTTVGIGILRDGLLTHGFEAADDLEFSAWLAKHGADPELTLRSNIVRVLYDLMFAYQNGREQTPNIAAGTGAKTLLLVFAGYDGAIMYKMQSGMGDTLFTPMYGLLKSRGVRFEFFHKVERLCPGKDGRIDEVHCTRQVKIKPAQIKKSGGYDPLLRVGEFDTWPARPQYEQIVKGDALRADPLNPGHPYDLESSWTSWPGAGQRVLKRGKDFDLVVCGIPLGALAPIAADLLPRSLTWRGMLQGPAAVATVRTQAMQLWFRRTASELGWVAPERMREAVQRGVAAPLLGGYLQPFNTWCDMSQLLPQEPWPSGDVPGSVAYLCGQMPDDPAQPAFSDHGYPLRERERVRNTARRWLDDAAPVLWPRGADPRSAFGIAAAELYAPAGADSFTEQYYRANIDPSERYVLSLAGTTKSRPPVNGPDFPNLYLCGDWVRNPVLSAGCVESSIASGMAAARAISGFPKKISGERV